MDEDLCGTAADESKPTMIVDRMGGFCLTTGASAPTVWQTQGMGAIATIPDGVYVSGTNSSDGPSIMVSNEGDELRLTLGAREARISNTTVSLPKYTG